jgi:hypothetical protein
MVTSSHEAMHRFFRDSPQALTQLLETAHFSGFPEIASAEPLPEDRTETKLIERRVDTVLAMTAKDGRKFILACEAQGGHSKATMYNKRSSWPYYLAHLHEQYKQPVVLLVLCQERSTVKWAKEPINLGLDFWPTMTVNPLVLGPHNVPMPREPFSQQRLAETVFGVMTHARDKDIGAILKKVAEELKQTDPPVRVEFARAIWLSLNQGPTANYWRDLMKAMEMDEELRASLHEGSVGEVVREFEAEAEAKGRAEGEAKGILRIVDRREIALTVEERERILACTDLETLNRWFDAALDATSAEEIFN